MSEVREQVAAAARRLGASGLVVGTAGNVSARDGDNVAVTATGVVLAECGAEQVVVVDADGTVVDGDLVPTSELALHAAVYDRHHAGAVVHTHAPRATALACVLSEPLPCVHYSMLALGGDVPIAPYATFGTPELAEQTAAALDGHTAALMASHGTIAFGADLAGAVANTELLEWACGVYAQAAALGTPRVLDADERQAVVEAAIARNYGSTQRIAP